MRRWRGTHGVKSSCACSGSFPAGSTALTCWCGPGHTDRQTDMHTHKHTSNADLRFLSDSDTPSERELDLSPLRPPAESSHPPHCSFHTWAWSPRNAAERTAASWTGALLDKRLTFFVTEAPATTDLDDLILKIYWQELRGCVFQADDKKEEAKTMKEIED